MNKNIFESPTIQGLFSPERSCEKFWSLRARIELSAFTRIGVESLGKEHQIPHPDEPKRRE